MIRFLFSLIAIIIKNKQKAGSQERNKYKAGSKENIRSKLSKDIRAR